MEIGRYRGMIANEHIRIGNNSYEKVKSFKYLRSTETSKLYSGVNKMYIKAGNSCYYSV